MLITHQSKGKVQFEKHAFQYICFDNSIIWENSTIYSDNIEKLVLYKIGLCKKANIIRGRNKMKKKLVRLLVLVCTAGFMVGCKENNSDTDTVNVAVKPLIVEDNIEDEIRFYSTEEDLFAIETPYCDLYYPLIWKDQISIEFEENDVYAVKFAAKVDSKIIPLFDLCFGSSVGDKIGELNIGDENINISMVSYEFESDEYSDDMHNDICGMNEDVNVIISKLLEKYDFTLGNSEQ